MTRAVWIATLVAAAVLLRAAISLHSYSGEGKPPMFGDFEAQRHWQEVTVNLPIRDWYKNTTDNDLMYWGLDYPPLTAYHSFLIGMWAQMKDPSFVKLHESRGIATSEHKNFMRNTVLLADVLYIPAIMFACYTIRKKLDEKSDFQNSLLAMALAVLYPGQILIDNGHFQYNNVSLGLAALAVSAILVDRNLLAAVLFVLALNYKQMELYHALPFFFYLLSWCFRHPRLSDGIWNLLKLASLVTAAFIIIWSPWLISLNSTIQVLHRVFPVARGVFEDKVSNVWCIVNVFVKLRDFDNSMMAMFCLICTMFAVIPSSLHLLFRPFKRNFVLALFNSALGFFLFSFQVHEKSILLATLPAVLLLQIYPFHCFWFLQVATFSMIPLLYKDGLLSAYFGCTLLILILTKLGLSMAHYFSLPDNYIDIFNIRLLSSNTEKKSSPALVYAFYGSLIGQSLLLSAFICVSPPARLPFLWPLLISAYSCGHFVLFFIYFNYLQFFSYCNVKISDSRSAIGKSGKQTKRKVKTK
ncbi:probable dolichyl pyrophosphate Man9GlcNAc2 alpha-1,3-glucosyltransferase [Toxorhynchites rutilus septentrionalis]|uniref:probable dolichyl pyrophosphate Man9GlcNAc2 alpha-1,3-glucosyltransferase n=1 Tax=Toxorhynchites rutilus septentrionalis TaxID=329112 RepID=UPI002479B260|nr:probable dolichyl pyrophosphate Man9GlcNAc2 alpha-1,3-glucosyltransferase [Toxorhynchites rutilus septentrionalis]